MNSTAHDWRNDDTPRRRPMDPTARKRPMNCMARRRPMDPTARIEGQWILRSVEGPWIIRPAGGPWLQQSMCCHDYFGLVSKNRLLWPLANRQKRTALTTRKQINKTTEINKQVTYARLSRLLHILHPLGIKVRHQCKYREQSNISYTLVVKVGDRCK